MFNSIIRKGFRDLSFNKSRTFFVILAITIGVFAVSVVADSYAILKREMDRNYQNTNPSSATLWTDSLSEAQMNEIGKLPCIAESEERERVTGRVRIGQNEWKDIWLFVVDDFNHLRLDTFTREEGAAVPARGEILFERKALTFTGAGIGQTVNIKIPGGNTTSLKLTGSVHAPGLAPSWMEGYAYGFITHDTYRLLGGVQSMTELKIKVTGNTRDKEHIRNTVYRLKTYLENKGIHVTRYEIPEPGKHPHYTQMAALLFLMEIFGIAALLLSGVLVAAIMTSILGQQTAQIGLMKAIGAGSFQIMSLYQGMVITCSSIALLLSIPLGSIAGQGYAELAATILNFTIFSNAIPPYIYWIEIASGLLVPLLASAVPIIRGSLITVRDAISDYGISEKQYSGRTKERISMLSALLPRPYLLSLRNTFRRKGRLIFSLLVMAVGGTGFITGLNIYASMYHTVDDKMKAFAYDIQVTFEQPIPAEKVKKIVEGIPEVKETESWGQVNTSRVYKDGFLGNSFQLLAPPASTKLLESPPLYSGRWLEPGDTNVIVVDQRFLSQESGIKVGDSIILRINKADSKWKIVGVSRALLGVSTAYVNLEYLSKLMKQTGYAGSAVIVTKEHTSAAQAKTAKKLEQIFEKQRLPLSSLVKLSDYRTSLINHMVIIASFLIIMSVLVVLVGGLGLALAISISTMERTREIGVIRAIGAPGYTVIRMIVAEGSITSVLSWLISVALSWPLSRLISMKFGIIFFGIPLEFAASPIGYAVWLIIIILIAAAASFFPSLKASRMEINKALYYI